MAAGGDLAAAVHALADQAANAGKDIGTSIGRFFGNTARIAQRNADSIGGAETEITRTLETIKPGADDLSLGKADGGTQAGTGRIARLLDGSDGADGGPGGALSRAFRKLVPPIGGAGGRAGAKAGELDAADPTLSASSRGVPGAAGDGNSSEHPPMTRKGDPVDVATGDVVLTQTDAALPGALPLILRRVHRSSQRGGRWFGESWTSSLDQRLLVMPDRVVCVLEGGQVLVYRRADLDAADTPVLPVTGPSWRLARVDDGTYTVTDAQRGLTWRFEAHPAYWRYADGQGEFPLTSVRDRAGHAISFAYGESGEPVSLTHSAGCRLLVTMSGGRVAALSLSDPSHDETPLVSYGYDDAGRLTEITDSSGRPLRMLYDGAGRVAGYADRDATSYRYTYDSSGRCVRGESPSGALSATYEYRDGSTLWTDATGAVTRYQTDPSFRITAVTDPLGGVTSYAHDERGRITSETDPLGRVTAYAFDDDGNLVAVTRPDGAVARTTYDDRCQAVEIEEPGLGTWRQGFDDRGNLVSLTQPDGSVVRYSYDEAGHLAAVTEADGAVTSVTCDARGLPVSETGPDGAVTRYERDQFGRVTRITDPAGAATAMTWTVEGRPLTRTFPDGSVESWTWDAGGNPLRHVSPTGSASMYECGPFGKITSVTGPDGTRTVYGYDAEMRLTSVEHGGLTWSYTHDAAGRVTGETDYNGARTRYELDAAGQVMRRVNAAGQEVRYARDALGNVVSQSAAGDVTTFAYDQAGDLVRAQNAAASVVFTRDALGRVTAESCDGRTVATSYDAAGRTTERVTPSGAVSSWAYDSAGLPVSLSAGGRLLRFSHEVSGRETSRELPGGAALAQDWDPLGQLTSQVLTGPGNGPVSGPGAPAALQRRRYTYNLDGHVTGVSTLMTGGRSFRLDATGRVTAVTGGGWTEQYAYDPVGNITSAAWPAIPGARPGDWLDAPFQGEHAVSGTLTSRAGHNRYAHDAAGRVIRRTKTRISRKPETWHYEWDADDRLTAVVTPDGSTWRYAYAPLGRRVGKRHVSPSGEVLAETRFTWDGLALAEQAELTDGEPDRETVTTWDYEPDSFTPLAQRTREAMRGAPQEVIDGVFYAIITDLVGMPTELVDPGGALAGFQQHTLWGGTVWNSGGASTPLRFPGQYADPETGLYYNNQRYYDPVSGAYLTPDPLGLSPAPNPHTYVPNPYAEIDPLGLAADGEYDEFGVRLPPGVSRQFDHLDDGVQLSNHARKRMRQRGVSTSTVNDVIRNGRRSPGNDPGTEVRTRGSGRNKVRVVVSVDGRGRAKKVITVTR